MRTIILHYHLFKNAGTSLDAILKKNFGNNWVTKEFKTNNNNNTEAVEDWIRQSPKAIAYSSHTMVGPIPNVKGVKVIPIILLRDPIARIRSAYRFEAKQDADTWGAKLAKEYDLEGYVKARLSKPRDRQCRNFHTARLATIGSKGESEIDRALHAASIFRKTGVIGCVENFNDAMTELQKRLLKEDIALEITKARKNVSKKIDLEESPKLLQMMRDANKDDIYLYRKISTAYTPETDNPDIKAPAETKKETKNDTVKLQTSNLDFSKLGLGTTAAPIDSSDLVEIRSNGLSMTFNSPTDRISYIEPVPVKPQEAFEVSVEFRILEGDLSKSEPYFDIVAWSLDENKAPTSDKHFSAKLIKEDFELGKVYNISHIFSLDDIDDLETTKFADQNIVKNVRFSTNPVRGASNMKVLISDFQVNIIEK